jgi:hypothetical protein
MFSLGCPLEKYRKFVNPHLRLKPFVSPPVGALMLPCGASVLPSRSHARERLKVRQGATG